MSALGQLSRNKYAHNTHDFVSRGQYIAEDIQPLHIKERLATRHTVKLQELTAINDPKCKYREMFHRGMHKHNPWDFKKLKDTKKEAQTALVRER